MTVQPVGYNQTNKSGNFLLTMLIVLIVIVVAAWLVKSCQAWISNDVAPSDTAITIKDESGGPKVIDASSATEAQKFCGRVGCVVVQRCIQVGGDCASITPGPKADYGTGFHVSADGRTRPNPPAGWKWAEK